MHVPEGWKKDRLGKYVEIHSGGAPSSLNLTNKGKYPYVKVEDMNNCLKYQLLSREYINDALKPIPKYSVLFPKRGAAILNNKVRIAATEFFIDSNMMALETLDDRLDSEFLYYTLTNEKLFKIADTSTIPQINNKHINPYLLLFPPFPEQQKIAQILSTWDKAIEKLEALIATKQKRKKALMQQLLTGKKRFTGFVKSEGIQKTKFGTIPSDWQYLHIADVAKQFSMKNNAGHDLPVLSCTKHYGLVDSLSYFGKQIFSEDTSTYKVVPRNAFAYATNHIEEGSIGYQTLYDKALISPMYTVFQTNENINDEFLYRLLKTELYRHIFEVNTSASVDRRGSLRWDQFSAIKIPVPSLPEQQKIASFFAVTDAEIETYQKQLASLKEQKKGLMQQLLTGKKRV